MMRCGAIPASRCRHLAQRNVAANRQVVDQGQRHGHVAVQPVQQRRTFTVGPTDGRRGARDVGQHRHDGRLLPLAKGPILPLHRGPISVQGDNAVALLDSDGAVATGVCADVQRHRSPNSAKQLSHGALLGGGPRLGVARLVRVLGPGRVARVDRQAGYGAPQVIQQGCATGGAHGDRCGRGAVSRMASLRSGVQVKVGCQAGAEPRATRQQLACQVERNPVHELRQQQPEAWVASRHQRKRRQEMLTELAVRLPRRVRVEPLEGERVDEDRPAIRELDVVGAGVAQGHAVLLRQRLGLERHQGRILELGEGPLEGKRDERQLIGGDHRDRVLRLRGEFQRGGFVTYEEVLRSKGGCQAARGEGSPVIGE